MAQESAIVQVGNDASAAEVTAPVYFYYDNSYSQTIYLQSELQAGEIVVLYYYFVDEPEAAPVTFYMGEIPTTTTSFAGTSSWIPVGDLTQVYSGTVNFVTGWNAITLDVPFDYSGDSNLVVACLSNNRNYTGKYFKGTSFSGGNRTLYAYRDSAPIDPASITTISINKDVSSLVPNTRFFIGNVDDYCDEVTDVYATVSATDQAVIHWTGTESALSYTVEYKPQSEEEWTSEEGITDETYTITNLSPLTRYDVRVRAVCENMSSAACETSFVTLPEDLEALELPYTQNFDDAEAFTGWEIQNGTNGWFLGTAVNNTMDDEGEPTVGGAMYVSNDNGTTNAYTTGSTSKSYFHTTVQLPENAQTVVSFDWKGMGESGYDYLTVHLVPLDCNLATYSFPEESCISGELCMQSEWQRTDIALPYQASGNTYRLVFLWKNDGGVGDNPPAAVDNIRIFSSSCYGVDDISFEFGEDENGATAELTVEDQNTDAQYVVEYRMYGQTDWQSVTAASPVMLSGLEYSAVYEVRVTSSCDGELSATSDPVLIGTTCGAVSNFPRTEGFEVSTSASGIGNQDAPLCWHNIDGGSSSYYFYQSTSYPYSGIASLYYSGASSATTTSVMSDWMISPVYTLTGSEMLSFELRNANTYANYPFASFDILIYDASEGDIASTSDTANFELLTTISYNDNSATWNHREISLTEYTGNYRLAIAVRKPARSFVLDEFQISAMPACPLVYGLGVGAGAEGSAVVSFSEANSVGQGYVVAYGTLGEDQEEFDPETAQTVTVAAGDELPVVIGGLTMGTTYYFAVKQNCGAEYNEIVSYTVPVITELPYTQNFNNSETVNEWLFSGSTSLNWFIGSATAAANESEEESALSMYVSNDGGTTNAYNASASATVYASAFFELPEAVAYNLSFDCKVGGDSYGDNLQVYLVPATENVLEGANYAVTEALYGTPTWTRENVVIQSTDFPAGVYKLVFKWKNDSWSSYQPAAAIDNVSFTALECAEVASVSLQAVEPEQEDGTPSVIVDFVDANAEGTNYLIVYRAMPSGELVTIEDLTQDDFPYTIEGLAFQTRYEVGVAVVCGEENITDTIKTTVKTPCSVLTVPWTENFTTDPFEFCWQNRFGFLPASGTILSSDFDEYGYWEVSNGVTLGSITGGRLDAIGYGDLAVWAITSSIDLTEGTTYQIGFDLATTEYYSSSAPAPAPNNRFGIFVSTDNGVSWNIANALMYADGDADTQHNYSDITNTPTRVIYKLVDSEGEPISGTVRFAFYQENYGYSYSQIHVDNVAVEEWSNCQVPYSVSVSAQSTTATLDFMYTSDGLDFEYALVEGTAEDLESASPVVITEEDLPLEITNLTPETTYSLAVRTVCDAGEYSPWTEAVEFTTVALPATVPYTCDFEAEGNNGWTIKNGEFTNKWHVGTPTGQTSRVLFISNDNGTTAAYTTSTASCVVAERMIQTGVSDSLTISFDLTIGGEDIYDFLKVYWVPADTNFTPASSYNTYFGDREYATNVIFSNAEDSYNHFVNLITGTQTLTTTIPNEPNTVNKLVFVWRNDGSQADAQPGAIIDNVSITDVYAGEQPEPCDAPTGLAVSAITQTGATVTWNGSASSYAVRLNGGTAETVTATTKTFTDLTAGTSYTVEVRSVCESGNSAWVSTTFTTENATSVTAPTVATLAATNVTHNGATLNGTITAGTETITAQGFRYKTSAAADWTEVSATGTTITATLSNLTAETAYDFKAFATTATGTVEGTVMTFTTSAAPIEVIAPTVATLAATNVTHNAATLNGTITAGNEAITAQGFRYKTSAAADWTEVSATGTTISTTLTTLTAETAYDFKAFATTASGTVEGSVMTFTTSAAPIEVIAPVVTTMAATSVTSDGATLNGTIVAGNEEITAQGFIYKQDGAADWTTEQVAGENIAYTLTGLASATTYRFKAFATTASGTVEGAEMSFTTLAGLADVENAAISAVIYPNPASERATLSIDGLTETAQIVLTDVQGRIILTDTLNAGAKTYELNVKSLASGVYYVRVIAGTTIATKKLIVE